MQMGPPPGGDPFGTIVVIAGAFATLFAFVVAIRVTLRPNEDAPDHPKNLILRNDR
jgi:hypothetical protein